jgi:hypothetical protein
MLLQSMRVVVVQWAPLATPAQDRGIMGRIVEIGNDWNLKALVCVREKREPISFSGDFAIMASTRHFMFKDKRKGRYGIHDPLETRLQQLMTMWSQAASLATQHLIEGTSSGSNEAFARKEGEVSCELCENGQESEKATICPNCLMVTHASCCQRLCDDIRSKTCTKDVALRLPKGFRLPELFRGRLDRT